MAKNAATLATLLALGGMANDGLAQEAQMSLSDNQPEATEFHLDKGQTQQPEQAADNVLEPQCYYNYIAFDRDGKCGESRTACYQVGGEGYSLFPLKERAMMDAFADGGKGAVVINQYTITDENAFLMAAGKQDLKQALAQFQTKVSGVQIASLEDVKACLEKAQAKGQGELLQKWADNLGLNSALQVKEIVQNINESNRSKDVLLHESTHWQDKEILAGIETGRIMVAPEHYYALKMVSEMKARMQEAKASGQTPEQALNAFEQESLSEYRTNFTQSAQDKFANNVSRRQLALALDDTGAQKVTQKKRPDDVMYVPNFDTQDGWVEISTYRMPEKTYCVYVRPDDVAKDVMQFTDKFDKVHPFNVLLDENKEPIKDEHGNMIAVTPIKQVNEDGSMIELERMQPSYAAETMKINYRLALRKMLQPLSKEEQQLLTEKLNSTSYQPTQNLDLQQNLSPYTVAALREETFVAGIAKEDCMTQVLEGSVKRIEQSYMKQSEDKAKSYVKVGRDGEAVKKTMSTQMFLQKAQEMQRGR